LCLRREKREMQGEAEIGASEVRTSEVGNRSLRGYKAGKGRQRSEDGGLMTVRRGEE
jgi:hypothetical protein